MKSRKSAVRIILVTTLLSLAFSSIAAAEVRLAWEFKYKGLYIRCYAPYQAYPGDTITIRLRVEALQDLRDTNITLWIFGSKALGYGNWTKRIVAVDNVDLSSGVLRDESYDVRIPPDADPGLIFNRIDCELKIIEQYVWTKSSYVGVYEVTYLRNKPFEDLQVAYDDLSNKYNKLQADYSDLSSRLSSLQASFNSLETSFNSLKKDYDSLKVVRDEYADLKSKYEAGMNELNNARTLNYVFVITTIVFVVISVYLAKRKPKIAEAEPA